jgi:uncharacterized protein (TIGR02596 family)
MANPMINQAIKRGFSLIELLVVMAIMAILAVGSIPALSSIRTSFQLTGAANQLMGMLTYGRQQAIALNAPIEVRFYQYVSPGFVDEQAGNGSFHAFQLLEDVPSTGDIIPLTRIQFLDGRIVLASSSNLSALLVDGASSGAGTTPPPAGLPTGYTYRVFHFRPDGSTDIASSGNSLNNFLTVADIVALTKAGAGAAPTNYATLIVDPISGTAKIIRP